MVKKSHGSVRATGTRVGGWWSACLVARVVGAVVVVTLLPSAVHAAQAVAVELPAGNHVHTGEYFPLLVTLEESEKAAETEVRVTLGDLTFSRLVSMSPGTSRKVLIWVVTQDEHPEVAVEVRSAVGSWSYPQLARTLTDTLRVLPRREHLVCILSASHNRELTWLFEHSGVTTVLINPRLEFPEEVLRVFDVVAFEDLLWDTLNQRVTGAIEMYVKSGGTVCISEHERIPFDPGSSCGLGEFFVLCRADRRQLRDPAKANAVKDRVLSALRLSEHREPRKCTPSEIAEAFEPLPRYLGSRPAWVLYLTVCFLTLGAAGLCGMLRLWSRRVGVTLMPALALGLSACFVFVVPAGDIAYERVSLVVAAAGSDTAQGRAYVQLYGFSDSGQEPHELGASGLILPAKRGYAGFTKSLAGPGAGGDSPLVLQNGNDAAVSSLYLQGGRAAVFEVGRLLQLDGGFAVSTGDAGIRFTNNSGFDLRDCVLILSGTVTELGAIRFGQTLSLNAGNGEFMQDYLRRHFDSGTRAGRTLAAFAQRCWKKYLKPGNMYVAGWVDDGIAPPGYAQAEVLGTMWIVETRTGR